MKRQNTVGFQPYNKFGKDKTMETERKISDCQELKGWDEQVEQRIFRAVKLLWRIIQ